MKKLFVALLTTFPLLANASNLCGRLEVAFYGKLENNSGFERLCYDRKKDTYFLGVQRTQDKTFDNFPVTNVVPFSFKDEKGNELVQGYHFDIPENNKVFLSISYHDRKIQMAWISVNNEAYMGFEKPSVVYNMVKKDK